MALCFGLALGLLGTVHRTKTLAFDVRQLPRNMADAALHEKLQACLPVVATMAHPLKDHRWVARSSEHIRAQSPSPILLDRELAHLPTSLLIGALLMPLKRGVALRPLQISLPLQLEGGRVARGCSMCSANDCCSHSSPQHTFMNAWCSRMPLSHAWRNGYFPFRQAHLQMVDTTALIAPKAPLKPHGWVAEWSGFERTMPTVPASWLDTPCALLLGIVELCNLLAFLLASLQRDRKRMLSGSMAMLLLLHSVVPVVQASLAVPHDERVADSKTEGGDAPDHTMTTIASVHDVAAPRDDQFPFLSTPETPRHHGSTLPSLHPAALPSLVPVASRRLQSTITVSTVAELTAAVADSSISRILLAAGTYAFSSGTVCVSSGDPSALCISRDVSLEALEPGTVVLDAQGTSSSRRRVMYVGAGTVGLIGLNITGGYASPVSDLARSCIEPFFLQCCPV